MALEVVSGALLSALLEQVLDKLASQEIKDFRKGKKLEDGLRKLKPTLLSVDAVLDDAEEKQLSNQHVKNWLHELKEAVLDAEDLLIEIKTEALRRKLQEADDHHPSGCTSRIISKIRQLISAPLQCSFDKAPRHKIEEILERLENIVKEKEDLDLDATKRIPKPRFHATTSLVDDTCAPSDLEEIRKQIVNKCKGHPLAEKCIEGLLRSLDVEVWSRVLNDDIWDSLDENNDILPALWLSYYYLPPHLKRCFAYCSIFPQGYEFEKSKLVLLWMAEDLLPPQKKEEVGEEYFNDLISRSFFQHSLNCCDKSVFTMHDFIHYLAKFVFGEFCFRMEDDDLINIGSKTRHCAYRGDPSSEKFEALHKARFLRTFLPLIQTSDSVTFCLIYALRCEALMNLQYLKVLSFSGYCIPELPNSISNLKHLRYLDLSCTSIQKLPDTLCSLYNLQTLLLFWCRGLTQLPTNLGRLINLRHLDIRNTGIEKMPPHMGKLKDLQTLRGEFVLDKHSGDNIAELKELQYLHDTFCISGLHNVFHAEDALEANLREKKYLNQLVLKWECDLTDAAQKKRESKVLHNLQPHTNLKELTIDSYGGTTFPGWLGHHSFSSLVSLRLESCKYCSSLPPLGQLPSLRKLEIDGLNRVVSIDREFYGGTEPFRSLEVLKFTKMDEWKQWCYGGVFPNLRELSLQFCPELTGTLPLEYFPKLEELDLFDAMLALTISQEPTRPRLLSLRKLNIACCPNVVCFPEGGLHAPNLTKIEIYKCEKLRSLPEQMHTLLPSLQSMSIFNCPELESFPEGGLPSKLKSLQIFSCGKLLANCRQWGLQTVTSLRELRVSFEGCEGVDSFPEEGMLPTTLTTLFINENSKLKTMDFRDLNSLEDLTIQRSPELQCFPNEGLPTSLSQLTIWFCPLLEKRCQRENGEDWPKISHIPNIFINGNGDGDVGGDSDSDSD